MTRLNAFLVKHFPSLCLLLGAVMVNVALDYGVGVNFGWWGFMFWAGLGLIYGGIKADA